MTEPTPAAARKDLAALRIDRTEPPPRRRIPGWLVAIVVILGAAAGSWPFLRGLSTFATQVTVAPALVERAPTGAETILAASGYVVARTKAAVSAKIPGRLEYLGVEEGSKVEAGQIIARLENDALAAEVDAARAAVSQATAALSRASADVDLARTELGRQQRLFDAGVGTRNALDTAKSQADSREAALREARASLGNARALRAQAEVGLENANVRAPFAGVVLRKEAEVGEYVAPSVASGSLTRGAIVTLADLASLEVEADVAEGNIARLPPEAPAEIALDAVPDRRYRGRLRQIMPTADRQKATVQVKVALLDADLRVKPEMSAKVTFLTGEPDVAALNAPPVVTAPVEAVVVPQGGGSFAWLVSEGRLKRQPLTVGERRGSRIVVTDGLVGGETLVLNPSPSLEEGEAVKVVMR